MTEVVKRIEARRKALHMTRAAMCRSIGIPPTTYSNYIIRGGEPDRDMLEKIAPVLEVTVVYLRTGQRASKTLHEVMQAITDRIAALPARRQEQIVTEIEALIIQYEK